MKTMLLSIVCYICAVFLSNGIVEARGDGLPATNSDTVNASRVCKPGPSFHTALATSKKCLVIGDSVSIGYTKWLTSVLQDVCEVYHAPWDTKDGGALDTKYAVKCLQIFLKTNFLEEVFYEVIVFNFGLHDADFDYTYPEEYTDIKTYTHNLLTIKNTLLATGSKVGYVLTTPVPFNVTSNNRVKTFNRIARAVMSSGQPIQIADLYEWVVLACGEPPYESCEIADKQPSPHYTKPGYRYLSVLVSDLISSLLLNGSHLSDNTMAEPDSSKISVQDQTVSCKNQEGQTVNKCPASMTCSPNTFSETGWGCCPLPHAVSCTDGKHCCPAGYECDPSCTSTLCHCNKN